MRKPIVSGIFYPSDFNSLDKSIIESFEGPFGPGCLPEKKREKKVIGIISPHAGYIYSGGCAAWGFKELAESPFKDTYIVLGNDHQGNLKNAVSTKDWNTPFGIIKNDIIFSKSIIDNNIFYEDNTAHEVEHSIEVQLPFLQHINKKHLKELKIVPIIISTKNYKDIAERIFKIISLSKKNVSIICSSDFTHHGNNYGYAPFKENIKENMSALDNTAIKLITSLDSKKFEEFIKETNATICGEKGIKVMIELCKLLGAKKARLLRYYTSADITNDYKNTVGYASIVFE